MGAVLLTVAMLGLTAVALIGLTRVWPRSFRRGGFRITHQDGPASEDPPVPEDDDAKWQWRG